MPPSPTYYRITCVCLGNICRSPMAESVLRQKLAAAGLDGRVEVDSAGTAGYHEGSDADPRALAALADGGYRLQHTARQFHPDWLTTSQLILVMDADNLSDVRVLARQHGVAADHVRLLRSFDPDAGPDADVPDPYYGGPDGFAHVLHLIERAADGIVAYVRAQL